MKKKTSNLLYRLGGYTIGFSVINLAVPNMGLKEWCYVTLGGCIIILTCCLFSDK